MTKHRIASCAVSFATASLLFATAAQARFLQADPVGSKDDPNLYTYVENDPANKIDPSGKTAVTCFINQTAGTANCTVSGDDQKPETTVTYHIERFTRDKNGDVHKSEQTKTVKYAPDALGAGSDVRNQVYNYLGAKPTFLNTLKDLLLAGASTVPLQTGGNTINPQTAKALGFDNPRDAGRALEGLKQDRGLAPDHHGTIMSNGDYVDPHTGEVLGNIHDYKP